MDLSASALSAQLNERSIELRRLILGAAAAGGRGHIGPAMSLVEIISELYDSILVHNPNDPSSNTRDIFILSKGHGCLALYAVLAQHSYFPVQELDSFCKFESRLGGHPEWHELPGVEFSTGSLGHGLAIGVGVAKAFKIKNELTRKVFVVLGDGELGEGSIWESAAHASKHKLDNLNVFIDYNKFQANGEVDSVLPPGDLLQKWSSFGFSVMELNGHSRQEIIQATLNKGEPGKPRMFLAHTIKGKGVSGAENSAAWHHKATISREEISALLSGTL
jgi:transketolase